MSEDLRRVHRAYVDAGLMPLKDYVAEYDRTKPVITPLPASSKPRWECCVTGSPIPEGFKRVMRLMGIEAAGVVINSSTGFTVTDKHGSTYTFQLSRFQIRE